MSLFNQELDKGGTLRDVVDVLNFSYPNGKDVLNPRGYYADETLQHDRYYKGYDKFLDHNESCYDDIPLLFSVDRTSHWPIFPDGFLCNKGKITYAMLFDKEFQKSILEDMYIGRLPQCALDGHIETLFIPRLETIDMKEVDSSRIIRDDEWWKMVEIGIKEGIENALDSKTNAKVFVERGYCGRLNEFYITLKFYGHEDIGDIFWPYNDGDRDRPGQLFGVDEGGWFDGRWRGFCCNPKIGTPVSITTYLKLRYRETK